VVTLRLEKSKYLLGETVRFWVGVRSTNGRPIREEVINRPCTFIITKPDGSADMKEAVFGIWPEKRPSHAGNLPNARIVDGKPTSHAESPTALQRSMEL